MDIQYTTQNKFSDIRTFPIKENSPLLDAVVRLADENSATLGFLPGDAFFTRASEGEIFVATDARDNVLGYLLYGTNKRDWLVYITHLCVDKEFRDRGVAKALLNQLVETARHTYRGIRVRCRRDYTVHAVWPKLGFYAIGEMEGRSKHGSTLTVWWYDFGHPTLFSSAVEQRTRSKLSVVIDANIFYDLIEPPTAANQLAHSLLSDWLDVELCLTNEIYTEINRSDDQNRRKRNRNSVDEFGVVSSPQERTQEISSQIRSLFPQSMSDNDESDLRQIAKTVAADIPYFVTNDEKLLKKSEDVYELFKTSIIRITDLVIYQDELMREQEYQPARLAGSNIQSKRVSIDQVKLLEDTFQYAQHERKSEFRHRVQQFLADPFTFEVNIVQNGEQPLALVVYSIENDNILDIPLFRVASSPFAATLAIHLLHSAITLCAENKRTLTRLTETYLPDVVLKALQENDFIQDTGHWIKVNLPIIGNIETFATELAHVTSHFPTESGYFHQLLDALRRSVQDGNTQALLQVEKLLWPAKITDLDIPTYIVSIQPQWAMDLFDPSMAIQTLFGADPSLMMNVENVYYCSSGMEVAVPARILWYVSKGNNKFQGTMTIRACSYLDEVVVDKPKALFSRFRRLGVYTWKDIFDTAKQSLDNELMAFRFSKTELFHVPVHRDDLQEIWRQTRGRKFNVLRPIKISEDEFLKIYSAGMKV